MDVSVANFACLAVVILLSLLYIIKALPIPKVKEDACCEDCGLPYQNFPMDVTIPDSQWTELTGYVDGEGLLCGACIIQRGTEKYIVARLKFE